MLKKLWNYTKRILKSQKGKFDITQFFGLGAKRPDLGPMKKVKLPYESLTEIPMGADVDEAIRQAMGEGFGAEFESKVTSPVVAGRRARFEEEELPAMEAGMSARGLGRSTIATEGMRRGRLAMGRDIDQIVAEAYRANVQAKERARGQGLAFTGAEAGQQAIRIQEEARRAGVEIGAEQAQQLADKETLNKIIATATALVSAESGQVPGIWAGGGGTSSSDTQALLDYLKKGQARPFTGGQQMTGGGQFMAGGQMRQIPSVPIPAYGG